MKKPLKAFVKYDATGRIVPGTLLLRKQRPVGAGWEEIPATTLTYKRTTLKAIELLLPDELEVGDIETAMLTLTQANGSESTLSEGFTLTSSDTDIISVDGVDITVEAEGEVTITATYQGKKSSVTITTTEPA